MKFEGGDPPLRGGGGGVILNVDPPLCADWSPQAQDMTSSLRGRMVPAGEEPGDVFWPTSRVQVSGHPTPRKVRGLWFPPIYIPSLSLLREVPTLSLYVLSSGERCSGHLYGQRKGKEKRLFPLLIVPSLIIPLFAYYSYLAKSGSAGRCSWILANFSECLSCVETACQQYHGWSVGKPRTAQRRKHPLRTMLAVCGCGR